jgi:hypothetical protein
MGAHLSYYPTCIILSRAQAPEAENVGGSLLASPYILIRRYKSETLFSTVIKVLSMFA